MLNPCNLKYLPVLLSSGNAVLGGAGGDGGDGNGNNANGGDFNSGDFSGNGGTAIGDNGNSGNGGAAIGGESVHIASSVTQPVTLQHPSFFMQFHNYAACVAQGIVL